MPADAASERPLSIVHVAWGHPPEYLWCGPVKYVHTLALAQQAAGHRVRVLCASHTRHPTDPRPHAPVPSEYEGIEYVLLTNGRDRQIDLWDPRREQHDPDLVRVVRERLATDAPDVIHLQNFAGLSFELVEVCAESGAAVVASLHNYTPVCPRDDLFFADSELCGGPLERSCSRCLGSMTGDERYIDRFHAGVAALNRCDLLLAVSTRVAEIFVAQGVDPARVTVETIGSTTADGLWESAGRARVAAAAAGERRTEGRPLRAVFFGTLVPRKGARVVLQALTRMADPTALVLDLYGKHGPDEQQVLEWFRVTHPELADVIRPRGEYTQDDLHRILADEDVAVLTPRWEDNGPQTVFEALGAGVPVVATRIGGIPDVVEHERNGLLFEEGDVAALATLLDRLVADPALVARLTAGVTEPRGHEAHRQALDVSYRAAIARRAPQAAEPAPAPATEARRFPRWLRAR